MTSRSMMTRRAGFLPQGAKTFAYRRAVELAGLTLLAAAAGLALALLSFNHGDPSFHVASGQKTANWLGWPGAYAADILLRSVGVAGVWPVLALAAWGWRISTHRGLTWWWMHAALLPLAVLLAAVMAACLPVPSAWPLTDGLGGIVGHSLLAGALAPLTEAMGLGAGRLALALVAAPPALLLLGFALGLTLGDWRTLGRALVFIGRRGNALVRQGGLALRRHGARREPKFAHGGEPEIARPHPRPASDPARVEKRVERPRIGRRAAAESEPLLDFGLGADFDLPELSALGEPPAPMAGAVSEEALEQNARLLESVLSEFGISGEITKVRPGPVVTLYELEPAPGTKSSRVVSLADDIARSMSALSARVAVVPGRNAIGIELPNARRETVYLRELLGSAAYENTVARLTLALGKDIAGNPVIADLARMPHLLVAGTTGSGKSVAINTMILSLLYRLTPDECRFIMIDPKMLELSVYDGIPHLLAPVVTEPAKAIVALKWTVREMEERYRKMSELGVRNIAGYNQRLGEARAHGEKLSRTVQTGFDPTSGEPLYEEHPLALDPLPFIVVIVDELADLMIVAGRDIEAALQRLAQMARAAGIHLIVATQRPSVDVITGTIKANFPTRISFQVTSKIDSRTILGEQGAEQLLGMGDMLFMPSAGRVTRVHGPFVSDEEVEAVANFLKAQREPEFLAAVTADPDEEMPGMGGEGGGDELYDRAVDLVCRERKASTSFIQRHLQIGYNRAARIIERMESEGVVGTANHVGKREVLARDIDSRA